MIGITKQMKELELEILIMSDIQPRKTYDEIRLKELAESLKKSGTLQPIIVRPKNDKYEILVGARRFKAAKIAGFQKLPAFILDSVNDSEALELALTENIQREDLTPLEEAWAILKLTRDYNYSVEKIAEKLGKSDSFTRKRLMLLQLPKSVQRYIAEKKLSIDSAAALTNLSSPEIQEKMAKEIIKNDLSIAQAKEMIVKEAGVPREKLIRKKKSPDKKVFYEIKTLQGILKRLNLEKMPYETRENIKAELEALRKQIGAILSRISELT